jgi:ABC-type multidrug transport system fused ATPase/permease subunit
MTLGTCIQSRIGISHSFIHSFVHYLFLNVIFFFYRVLRQFAQFLFGSAYLIKISPKLSLWTFAGILVVAWVSAVYGTFNRKLAQKVQDTFADATAVAETSFSMSETIRAFDGVSTESAKYEGAQGKALDLEEVQAWGYGTHKFVSDTLQAILQALLLFACWTVGRAGGLPASQLTTYMFYTNFVLESSNEVGDQWAKIQGAIGASSSVFDLIRRIPRVRDPPKKEITGEEQPLQANGSNGANEHPIIEMSNTTVTYGTMDVPALNGVNLKIYEGDRVAIVGRSGSGKSSMLRSILRFYDPVSGSVRLDGKPLTDMSRKDIASRISVVEQEPHLFPMSLMDNVLYGIEKDVVDPVTGEASYGESYRAAAIESLQIAGLPILPGNDLNLELNTRVGEGGRSLSGGQRQRVAIARTLIRRPCVLLLDEPTAALDSQSEKAVVGAIRKAMEYSKSMVMVTHRLGVVRALDVNRVIVLEKGEIAESGHPEELLRKKDGLYASIAREQGITTSMETAM